MYGLYAILSLEYVVMDRVSEIRFLRPEINTRNWLKMQVFQKGQIFVQKMKSLV